jgi:hypothetical protein
MYIAYFGINCSYEFRTHLTTITAAFLVSGTKKDVMNYFPPASSPEPPLTPVVGENLDVHLLQDAGHRGNTYQLKTIKYRVISKYI